MKLISGLLVVTLLVTFPVLAANQKGFGGANSYDAPEAQNGPILRYVSSNGFKDTIDLVKQAVAGANYRLIRVQNLDYGLVNPEEEDARKVIIYFCNFKTINDLVNIDPRVGVFLPCRITVMKVKDKVIVESVNPKILSKLLDNENLKEKCEQMQDVYRNIIEEAVL